MITIYENLDEILNRTIVPEQTFLICWNPYSIGIAYDFFCQLNTEKRGRVQRMYQKTKSNKLKC